ncbi:hypothetical protein AAG570_011946 [Ranatra chinensis]|uniref:Copine-3 n=1 Tax=Ranatra chinensis TaxID=642074 RepID=A0ABD0YHK9_9HEMI
MCKDLVSKSDPMCVTFVRPFGNTNWVEYHRTETVTNSHDPDFVSKVHMMYRFEEQQPIRFEIYDIDSSSTNLRDHQFLGWASCTLGQIISKGTVKLPLCSQGTESGDTKHGFLIVAAEELSSLKDEAIMTFSGQKLDKKDFFGKSDPFLEIFKATESGNYVLVHRTEVIKNTLNPVWKEVCIPVRKLCNGDYERSLKIVCYDWNSSGSHSLIGEFSTNVREMQDESLKQKVFTCVNPHYLARKKESYKGSGQITLNKFVLKPIYTFMDYIKGGTQINCTFAIDFTASNGPPYSSESLHYICPGRMNCYEQAIMSVGSIVEDYDSDKQFPVLGFGARLPPDGRVSHEFFVNFSTESPFCSRVQGVLEAYQNCIRYLRFTYLQIFILLKFFSPQVQLSGPTNFAPVIRHVSKFAASFADGSNYFILLIITDGVITDMAETSKAIVEASMLPMSVIIVGVGNADFEEMEKLDGDTVALSAGGRRATRDIVQFVPYDRCIHTGTAGIHPTEILAREVLAEIPYQFIEYMKMHGIVPKPPNTSSPFYLPPDLDMMVR